MMAAMTLYLDRHELTGTELAGVTRDQMMETHRCDLSVQSKYGVRYLTYWWREGAETAFCLVEAPSREAAESVHREAHGQVATSIIEVEWPSLEAFLGPIVIPPDDEIREDVAFRVILSVSFDGAAPITDPSVEEELTSRGASAVVRDSDDLLSCFASPEAALRSAMAIRRSYIPVTSFLDGRNMNLRIGISGGEPVFTHVGLFGDAINEARALRRAAAPGEVLVSPLVHSVCQGKGFDWAACPQGMRLVGQVEMVADLATSEVAGLSAREVEVLRLVASGNTNEEIAARLCISRNTVATHLRHILEKTSSANRAEASTFAVRRGLV
jgi:DNA-binding CsgD family transcriptional regulator